MKPTRCDSMRKHEREVPVEQGTMTIGGIDVVGKGKLDVDAASVLIRDRLLAIWPSAVIISDDNSITPLSASAHLWAVPCELFVWREEHLINEDRFNDMFTVMFDDEGVTFVVEQEHLQLAMDIRQALRLRVALR